MSLFTLRSATRLSDTLQNHQIPWLIGAALLMLMIVTRSHLLHHLHDASWAVFLLAGFYLRSRLAFPVFFLAAFLIDLVVIDAQGGQHYCFTPSYPFLIPAYASLWLAGRWLRRRFDSRVNTTSFGLSAVAALLISTTVCFVIANAGFYAFSGKFTEIGVLQYGSSVMQYLAPYVQTTALYSGFVALIHAILVQLTRSTAATEQGKLQG